MNSSTFLILVGVVLIMLGLSLRKLLAERKRITHRANKGLYYNKISSKDKDLLRAFTGGVCQCCGEPGGYLIIEHNHSTGRIRGVTCQSCNVRIGNYENSRGHGHMNYIINWVHNDGPKY